MSKTKKQLKAEIREYKALYEDSVNKACEYFQETLQAQTRIKELENILQQIRILSDQKQTEKEGES